MEKNLNKSSASQTVLITGSSSGIGLHLAKEFANHGHPLVLVAPESVELESVADELRESHQINVTAIAKDLREDNAAQAIFEQLDGRSIEILVNNAGHGQKGKAWEIPLEDDLSMVALNILAILRLTKLFLPPMVAQGEGVF
jgi:short-subunit dehydrogenase